VLIVCMRFTMVMDIMGDRLVSAKPAKTIVSDFVLSKFYRLNFDTLIQLDWLSQINFGELLYTFA